MSDNMDPIKVLEDLGFSDFKDIGQGAFGTVKLAKCRRYRDKVAIKIMDPMATNDARIGAIYLPQEVSILKKLSHPNIIHVHEMYTMPKGQRLVVMEAAEMDLKEKIMELDKVPIDLAKNWFCQILGAMIYVHDQAIAHRDIKCGNILLMADNQVKLTDFGLGCISYSEWDTHDTRVGTLHYIAPEVRYGDYDPKKADVWSLGVLLFVLVTGELPYDADDFDALLLAHEKPFMFPEGLEVEESCRSLISYMLQVDPDNRPSMREVAAHPWVRLKYETLYSSLTNSSGNEETARAHPPAVEETDHLNNEEVTELEKVEYASRSSSPPGCAMKRAAKAVKRAAKAVKRAVKAVPGPILKAARSLKKKLKVFKRNLNRVLVLYQTRQK